MKFQLRTSFWCHVELTVVSHRCFVLQVFINVILPIFVVVAVTWLFQRWRRLDVSVLSQTTLWLFSPAFVFSNILDQQASLSGSVRVTGSILLATALMLMIGLVVSKLFRYDRKSTSAFMLSTAFPNAGNMGLPVLLLAFGDPGIEVGILIFVVHAIVGFSVGIFVAASSDQVGLRPLISVFRLPTMYAFGLALLVKYLGISLPVVILEPVSILGAAAIPVMITVLGFQLGSGVETQNLRMLFMAVIGRLIVAVPIYMVATVLMGLSGITQGAVIVIGAMPSAVFTTILADEFGANPRFVTSSVVLSTAASVVTLTILVTLIRDGILLS